MNAKNTIAALGLLTLALASHAADLDSVNLRAEAGVSREQVKAELQRALANGEIVHGNLAHFHQLLAPAKAAPTAAVAAKSEPAPRPAGTELAASRRTPAR